MMFLCLKPDGDVCEMKRSLNPKFVVGDTTIGLQYLKGVVETKGRGKIERLSSWDFQGNTVYMYGWKNGTDESISCHSLPKPLDKERVYGDILCFMTATAEDVEGDDTSASHILDFTEAIYLDFFQWVTCDIDVADEESDDEEDADEECEEGEECIEIDIEDVEDPGDASCPTTTVDKIIQEIVKKSRRSGGGVRSGKGATMTKMYNYQFMDLCVADNELEIEAEYVVVG
jgi:hypothetical protein